MSNGSSQRQSPRYPVQLPLLYQPTGPVQVRVGVGWTVNLSERGTCVELNERLEPRTPLRVRFRTDRGPIEVEAVVLWVGKPRPDGGGIFHGLGYSHIAPDQQQALRDLLLPFQFVPHAGVRLPLAVPVTCLRKDEVGAPVQGSTGDVSRAGALLLLPQAFPPRAPLIITLHSPSGPITVEGVILWVEPPERQTPGEPIRHGLRFTSLTWSVSLALGLLLVGQPLPST
jgi:hypothetical protein